MLNVDVDLNGSLYRTPSLPKADGAVGPWFKSDDPTGTARFSMDWVNGRDCRVSPWWIGREKVFAQTILQLAWSLVFTRVHRRSWELCKMVSPPLAVVLRRLVRHSYVDRTQGGSFHRLLLAGWTRVPLPVRDIISFANFPTIALPRPAHAACAPHATFSFFSLLAFLELSSWFEIHVKLKAPGARNSKFRTSGHSLACETGRWNKSGRGR